MLVIFDSTSGQNAYIMTLMIDVDTVPAYSYDACVANERVLASMQGTENRRAPIDFWKDIGRRIRLVRDEARG